MTDQIQTQQSSGESKLPWFNSLGNPWSVSIPIGPGQDPMIQTWMPTGKRRELCKVKVWVWATCCSGACWSHQCSNPRNRVRWARHPFSAQNWRDAPKPSNQDTTLMQYFLKIKTNVKKKNTHNEQIITIVRKDKMQSPTCSTQPYFPHPSPNPVESCLLFIMDFCIN